MKTSASEKSKRILKYLITFSQKIIALLFLFILALMPNFASSVFDRRAEIGYAQVSEGILICFVVFAVCIGVLYLVRRTFFPFEIRKELASTNCPKESLILFVSRQEYGSYQKGIVYPTDRAWKRQEDKRSVALKRSCAKDLIEDAKLLDQNLRWNWEMILRAVHPHLEKLKRIHLIGSPSSPSDRGSFRDLDLCKDMLSGYLQGNEVEILAYPQSVDFTKHAQLRHAVDQILQQDKRAGVNHRDICIDVTGGQKLTSIFGSMTTYRSDLSIQYVDTNPPKDSYIYDIILSQVPSAE